MMRPSACTGLKSDLLFDARGLAGPIAQVIQLGAPYAATTLDRDLADARAVNREGALDAFTVRHLAHRERGIEAAIAARNHDALIGLHPLAVSFDHLDLHHDRVAGLECRHFAGHSLRIQRLNDVTHGHLLNSRQRQCAALAKTLPTMSCARDRAAPCQSTPADAATFDPHSASCASAGSRRDRPN